MTSPQSISASLARERTGHAAWNRLFELAATEHCDAAASVQEGADRLAVPEWARLVAELCGYQLLPVNWRIEVGRAGDGVTLTLHSPGGYGAERGTFTVAHGVDTVNGNIVADFGRALMAAGVAPDPDPVVTANLDALAALRRLRALKTADGTYLDNDGAITRLIDRIQLPLERRVQQNEAFRAMGIKS